MQIQSQEILAAWEFVKNLMGVVTTALMFWIGKTLFDIRDIVRDHAKDVPELKIGLKNVVDRIEEIERRNIVIDGNYRGPERRTYPRSSDA